MSEIFQKTISGNFEIIIKVDESFNSEYTDKISQKSSLFIEDLIRFTNQSTRLNGVVLSYFDKDENDPRIVYPLQCSQMDYEKMNNIIFVEYLERINNKLIDLNRTYNLNYSI